MKVFTIILVMMLFSCETSIKNKEPVIEGVDEAQVLGNNFNAMIDSLSLDCEDVIYLGRVKNILMTNSFPGWCEKYINTDPYIYGQTTPLERENLLSSIKNIDTLIDGEYFFNLKENSFFSKKRPTKREYVVIGFSEMIDKKNILAFSFFIRSSSLCKNSGGGYFFFKKNSDGKWILYKFLREWASFSWQP